MLKHFLRFSLLYLCSCCSCTWNPKAWLKGHLFGRKTQAVSTLSSCSSWPHWFCPYPPAAASGPRTFLRGVAESMGPEADCPGSSPRHHSLSQFLSGPSPPQLKNGANHSASLQELLCALNTVSGTKPSYRVSCRL